MSSPALDSLIRLRRYCARGATGAESKQLGHIRNGGEGADSFEAQGQTKAYESMRNLVDAELLKLRDKMQSDIERINDTLKS